MTPDEERIAELEAELAALRAKPKKKAPAKKRAAKKKAAAGPAKRAPLRKNRPRLKVIPVYREGGPDLKKLAQAIVETIRAQHELPLDRPRTDGEPSPEAVANAVRMEGDGT